MVLTMQEENEYSDTGGRRGGRDRCRKRNV